MTAKYDLLGKRFGKWLVLERTAHKKTVRYLCLCDCGTEREVLSVSLRNGKSISCGCAHAGDIGMRTATHRLSKTATHNSWAGMKQRCDYAGHAEYHRYGGRGITYDPSWRDFAVFLADMGPKPHGTSLDRIDNDGPYCKANCRWATRSEQSNNSSRNVVVAFWGARLTLKQLARGLGLEYELLHKWHRDRGLPLDQAIARSDYSSSTFSGGSQ